LNYLKPLLLAAKNIRREKNGVSDQSVNYGLTFLVHGHSKHGKSWLGDTTPAPRLIIDAEAGSRFTPSKKKRWDPTSGPPPPADGSWETVIIPATHYRVVNKAWEWLNAGSHPFRSVVVDSISEVQQKIIDEDYGQLLRIGADCIRRFRDLVMHPTNPLDAVVLIAMTRQGNDGVWRPHFSGQLATTAPYLVDIEGFMAKIPQEDGTVTYRLFTGTADGFETGERVGGRLGNYTDNPDIAAMCEKIRGNGNHKE
jgi:hypothetical protein